MPLPHARRAHFRRRSLPLVDRAPERDVCLELNDHSVVQQSAVQFFGLQASRDPHPQAARLCEQFTKQNRSLFSLLDVRTETHFDGNDLLLRLISGNRIGAIPLFSPTRGTPDYGLVVQPRFPWRGIGPMLADMGWRVAPTPLKLPLLRRSERRVPPWVLSSMILMRLQALLESLTRRFESTSTIRTAPKGRVDWHQYSQTHLPRAQFLSVPCTYPDLRDDRLLQGAIRYALERQLRVLQTQVEHGAFVHRLIELCEHLLMRVHGIAPMMPPPNTFEQWVQRPMRSSQLIEGLQAIEWTANDRGLAGLSDLDGIPWTMPMNEFFEAFVETVLAIVARRLGAQLKVGRRGETTRAISWSPPFVGSQGSLIPDLWLEWQDTTLILDAKYKRHWQDLQECSWAAVEDEVREQHRNDLFQVLAYGNLAVTKSVIACLVFPCTAEIWKELQQKGRLIHKADLQVGPRSLRLWLTAIPMGVSSGEITEPIETALRNAVYAS